jgi:pyrroline-5-carboxylate reductase
MSNRTSRSQAKTSILLVGAGRMGRALLGGWLAGKLGPIIVVEPDPAPDIKRFARARRITLHADIDDVDVARLRACVLAIKPQILKTEAARFKAIADHGALILSIAAGTSTKSLTRACGTRAKIIRAMPNLPGAVGRGISALYAGPKASAADRKTAAALLAPLGDVVWVRQEAMIDAVTAVSGSGPAYVFLLVEALARAAEAEGLPAALASRLARATITGAGALLDADKRTPEELRRDVTSPKGTTAAALETLMEKDALVRLIGRAVAAARRRAVELRG